MCGLVCESDLQMSAQSVLAATLVEPGHYEIREYPASGSRARLCSGEDGSLRIVRDRQTHLPGYGPVWGRRHASDVPFPIIQGLKNVGTIAAIGGDGHYRDFEVVPAEGRDRVMLVPM